MKKSILLLGIVIVALSCKKEDPIPDDPTDPIPTNCNVITLDLNAEINEPTTWTAGNVYVVQFRLDVNSVLTIEPGVIVKLKNNGAFITVPAGGKIIANGNATNRVVFTSFLDDSYCGDSNGDGSATSPQKGDWGYMSVSGSNSEFNYCDFKYGGASLYKVISGTSQAFFFDNCSFAHTLDDNSTNSYAFGISLKLASQEVTNCVFYDNNIPVSMYIQYQMSNTNIFHNPSNVAQTNKRNGIWIIGATNSLDGNTVVFNETEVPYVLNNYYYVSNPEVLVIGENVVVKTIGTSNGLYRANAGDITYHPSVIFTSYKDDSVGGDTNGDGNITFPSIGDWKGIRNAWITSGNAGDWENNANIRYAEN